MDKDFNIGDKVVLIGTTKPVMTIQGHPMKPSNPSTTDYSLYTCFWEDSKGFNYGNFNSLQIEHFSDT